MAPDKPRGQMEEAGISGGPAPTSAARRGNRGLLDEHTSHRVQPGLWWLKIDRIATLSTDALTPPRLVPKIFALFPSLGPAQNQHHESQRTLPASHRQHRARKGQEADRADGRRSRRSTLLTMSPIARVPKYRRGYMRYICIGGSSSPNHSAASPTMVSVNGGWVKSEQAKLTGTAGRVRADLFEI